VVVARTTLGDEQVVVPILLVEVWSFWVTPARTVPNAARGLQRLARLGVDLAEPDAIVGIAHHVAVAVLEVERRVDATLFQPYGVRPLASGIVRIDEEIAAAGGVGGNHVERAVVVADGGGIDASPREGSAQVHLTLACQTVAYLFPVYEVAAVPQRNAGEVVESTVHQIVVAIDTTDARVGIEARNHRIAIVVDGISTSPGEC